MERKRSGFAIMALAGALALGILSCALPTGEDWIEAVIRQQSIGPGAVLDLTPFVPAPAAGATPVRAFSAGSFVGLVEWEPGITTGLFLGDTAYTAAVTLYPLDGYTFAGGAGFSYAGKILNPVYGTIGDALLEIAFDDTGNVIGGPSGPAAGVEALDLDLARYITVPAAGGAPVRAFSSAAESYVGVVEWEPEVPYGDAFQAKTAYTAAVRLSVTKGYTFAGAGSFTYTNEKGTLSEVDPGSWTDGERTVAIVFKETGTGSGSGETEPTAVTGVNLALYFPPPMEKFAPVFAFGAVGFGGTVAWKDGGGNEVGAYDVLMVDNDYTAAVTLYAYK